MKLAMAAVAIAICAASIDAQAGVYGPQITGVTAACNRSYDAVNFQVDNLVNDSGMSGDYEYCEYETWWMQYAPYGVNAQVTFDLGSCNTVNAMKIWNVLWPGDTDIGVKEITLWSSIYGTTYTQIGSTYTLAENETYTFPDGNSSYYPSGIHEVIVLGGVGARYIRMDVQSNYGDPSWYGIGEVRFFGYDPPYPELPEPGAITMLACAVAGLLCHASCRRIRTHTNKNTP